jgi:hypothetical protein
MYGKILYFIILGILTFVVALVVTDFFEESASPSVYISLLILGIITGASGYYIYATDFDNKKTTLGENSDNSTTPIPEQQYIAQPYIQPQTFIQPQPQPQPQLQPQQQPSSQSYIQPQLQPQPQPYTGQSIDGSVKYYTKVNELNKNIKRVLKTMNK